MSLSDAFGPAPRQSSDATAILRVRTAIFARLGPGNPYRSPLAIATMHAAELAAGGKLSAKRRRMLEAAQSKLDVLAPHEVAPVLRVVRAIRDDTTDPEVKSWASRAASVLAALSPPAPAAAPTVTTGPEPEPTIDPEYQARIGRDDCWCPVDVLLRGPCKSSGCEDGRKRGMTGGVAHRATKMLGKSR